MSSNIQRLGNTLTSRMAKTAKAAIPATVELGIINGDLSLSVDSLPGKISPSDYMVDLSLTHETYYTYNELYNTDMVPARTYHKHYEGEHSGHESGDGGHKHTTDGLHDHRVPSVFRRLKAGDRVLVIWVGHEPIIISIVVAGDTITPN